MEIVFQWTRVDTERSDRLLQGNTRTSMALWPGMVTGQTVGGVADWT